MESSCMPGPDRRLAGEVGGDAGLRRCRGRGLRAGSTAGSISSSGGRVLRSGSRALPPRRSCSSAAAGDRRRQGDARRPRRPRAAPGARRRRARRRRRPARPAAARRSRRRWPPKSLPAARRLTAFDWLPGTSKPPPVRWSVWRAARGSARTTIATQAARTQRRWRPRNPASWIIDSRIGWPASLSNEQPGVCEEGHARTELPLRLIPDVRDNAQSEPRYSVTRR